MGDHDDSGTSPDVNPAMEQVVQRLGEINEHLTQMAEAVENRDMIGQAKGILMERYRISSNEAFALLVSASNGSNTKLGRVASTLVTSGQLPDAGHR